MAKTVAELSAYCDVLNERLDATSGQLDILRSQNGELAEQLQAAQKEMAVLRERADHFRQQLDEARDGARNQERVNAEMRQENALLRQRLDDHLKRVETWDTRRWGLLVALVVALFGASLSLASGLIVTLARK